ncbi:DUF1285 domain-containing protein [Billgrantia desiderata]|uniref:DUF1285 domain-containing protein n=1 Tax=Billgrantia desiderata TaxID=52021 RepID=A0AAW4Z253_9GAMM|nr:DUF1285 domain-containing protein [Halomonas desiderata]MCE8012237.1 DUF1285 domain-containing protein [Halomonas desiderata]MCE8043076.1 DUF1285 domain-containing protein [Halomonas desiderata]MCE8047827.1 DUF1285 domain-containing protein [Halomonas desiderata]MCE8053605.1 DUF1285 domain-containing protein [Halomonas desiderata]NIC38851.1 DUF1285 domain-containing protein [Halomonas desiderata]
MNLDPLLNHVEPDGAIPPLERWQPGQAGDMDLEIAADGRWFHEGSEMTRPRLVRLLSTLLRREEDGEYYLVTPVEKQRIRVVDRPFVVVDADYDEAAGCWWLTTHAGDRLRLDETHRLRLSATPEGAQVPEVPVRFGLAARLGRNVYYRLVEAAEQRPRSDGSTELGLTSAGCWQPLGELPAEAS